MSGNENIDARMLESKLAWIEEQIQSTYPWQVCSRCAKPENPEDVTTHVDHFFDLVKAWAGKRRSSGGCDVCMPWGDTTARLDCIPEPGSDLDEVDF